MVASSVLMSVLATLAATSSAARTPSHHARGHRHHEHMHIRGVGSGKNVVPITVDVGVEVQVEVDGTNHRGDYHPEHDHRKKKPKHPIARCNANDPSFAGNTGPLLSSIIFDNPNDCDIWRRSLGQQVTWSAPGEGDPEVVELQLINRDFPAMLPKPFVTLAAGIATSQQYFDFPLNLPRSDGYVILMVDPNNNATIWSQGGKFAVGEWRVPEEDGRPIEIPDSRLRQSLRDSTAARSAAGRTSSASSRVNASNARAAGNGVRVVPADKVGAKSQGNVNGKAKGHGKGHGKGGSKSVGGGSTVAPSPSSGSTDPSSGSPGEASPTDGSSAGAAASSPDTADSGDASFDDEGPITMTDNVVVTSTRAGGRSTGIAIAQAALATSSASSPASASASPPSRLYDIQTTVLTATASAIPGAMAIQSIIGAASPSSSVPALASLAMAAGAAIAGFALLA